jgi:hypothetical protein
VLGAKCHRRQNQCLYNHARLPCVRGLDSNTDKQMWMSAWIHPRTPAIRMLLVQTWLGDSRVPAIPASTAQECHAQVGSMMRVKNMGFSMSAPHSASGKCVAAPGGSLLPWPARLCRLQARGCCWPVRCLRWSRRRPSSWRWRPRLRASPPPGSSPQRPCVPGSAACTLLSAVLPAATPQATHLGGQRLGGGRRLGAGRLQEGRWLMWLAGLAGSLTAVDGRDFGPGRGPAEVGPTSHVPALSARDLLSSRWPLSSAARATAWLQPKRLRLPPMMRRQPLPQC